MKGKVFKVLSVLVLLAVVLTACTGQVATTPAPTSKPPAATTPAATPKPPAATTPAATPTAKPPATTKPASTPVKLPSNLTWSSYEVGASTYMMAAAVAEGVLKKFGVQMRNIPLATDIGRLLAMATGQAQFSITGMSIYFASRGTEEFSAAEWGPQDLRMVWTIYRRASALTVLTTKTTGVKTMADMKGKRMGYIPGSPAINITAEGALAWGDLTWNDVKKVEFPAYTAGIVGLGAGQVDAVMTSTNTAQVYEIAQKPAGIYWVPFPYNDKVGWEKIWKVAPYVMQMPSTIGADIDPNKPVETIGYTNHIFTYARVDEDLVYNMTKAIYEAYDTYLPVNRDMMLDWELVPGKNPILANVLPYHEGTVRFFKEIGFWSPAHQAGQDKQLAILKGRQEAWAKMMVDVEAKKVPSKDIPKKWAEISANLPK